MRLVIVSIILVGCFSITGCAGLVVTGAATGAVVAQDRRTFPTQIEDQNIELKTITAIFEDDNLWDNTNIDVVSYNTNVLLLGQTPTASLKIKAQQEVEKIENISKVFNEIRVAAPISFFARRNDEYITSKVKSAMLFKENFPSGKITVVTENAEVFLLGLVTKDEADKAVDIARNIDGVIRVIKVFETIEDEPATDKKE